MDGVGDPAPPDAEVIETLTPHGPLQGDTRGGAASTAELKLIERGPLDHANIHADVVLRFNEPLDLSASTIDFAIDPPIHGEIRNATASQFSFAPAETLREATKFSVHAKGVVRTEDGREKAVDERWSFETPRATVQIFEDDGRDVFDHEDDRADWTAGFGIQLSHEISEPALRKGLRVVAIDDTGRESPQPFHLEGSGEALSTHWRLTAKRRWPADRTIKVSTSKDLTTAGSTLPIGKSVFATLRTRDGVHANIECYGRVRDGCPPGEMTLSFDSMLTKGMAKKISISPKPPHFEMTPYSWYGEDTFDRVGFYGEFKPGTVYTVRVGSIRDTLGQRYVGPRKHKIAFVAPPPQLQLRGSGTMLSSDKGTFGVESRNVEGATLSLSTLDDAALAKLVASKHDEQFRPRKGVKSRSQQLKLEPHGTYGWDARSFSLATELGTSHGAAFVELSPGDIVPSQVGRAEVTDTHALLQLTDLGAAAGISPAGSFVRVTSLETAKPVANAQVLLFDAEAERPKKLSIEGTTNSDGIATIGSLESSSSNIVVIVKSGGDRFAFPLGDHGRQSQYGWRSNTTEELGVMMADRNLVQPGERMRVMGWIARSGVENESGLSPTGILPVELELTDRNRSVLDSASVKTKAHGKFWATFDVPKNAVLGTASISAKVGGQTLHTNVKIKQFVAPAFDVNLALEDTDLVGTTKTRGHAVARYLHGMAVPVKSATLQRRCSPRSYSPPGADVYRIAQSSSEGSYFTETAALPSQALHARGMLDFDVDFGDLAASHAYRCKVQLSVSDAAYQQITTTTSAWVHPSSYVVSTHTGYPYVNKPFQLSAEALNFDGTRVGGNGARYRVERIEKGEGGREQRTTVHTCTLSLRAEARSSCAWTPKKRGLYAITLEAEVDGEKVSTGMLYPVRSSYTPPSKSHAFAVVVPKKISLGEAFDIGIESELPSSTGAVVQVHAGIRALHAFATVDYQATLHLDPREAWVPTVYFDTLLTSTAQTHGLPTIEYDHAQASLGLDSRRLEVEIHNPSVASIRERLPIEVSVRDHEGHGVENARVSIWAVDEGILMLEPWNFPNFVDVLTPKRGNEARYFDGFGQLRHPYKLRDDPYEPSALGGVSGGLAGGLLGGRGSGTGSGYGAIGGAGRQPEVRGNFDPSPIFIGDVATNAEGVAKVQGLLPDNLTTFRIAAIATAEVGKTRAFGRAGQSESRVRVTRELAARPVMPRAMRPGDHGEVGVLVDNLAGAKGELTIEAELIDTQGIASLAGNTRKVRRIDSAQALVPFALDVRRPGKVRVRVRASLKGDDGQQLSDASELTLDVRAERTLEHRAATYGTLDEDAATAIGLAPSDDLVEGSASANVEVFTSLLGGYRDSVDTVIHYPYGCLEQTSSRLVPLLALGRLEHYDLGVSSVDDLIETGINRIYSMQTEGGGLAYWPDGNTPQFYSTAYATWVLVQLEDAGYPVPSRLINRAAAYLELALSTHGVRGTPSTHEDVRAAMALHALSVHGGFDPGPWKGIFDRAPKLPTFARALLAMALHTSRPDDPRIETLLESLRKRIDVRGSFARSKAEALRFTEFFDSPVRTDALVLLAFATIAPDDELVDKLARGLAKARDGREIRNTQESAYALLAMAKYAELREEIEPDLDVRAWVDESMVLDETFEGRDLRSERSQEAFTPSAESRVTLERTGAGRLYYRVGMRWQPEIASIEAMASGLQISRSLRDDQGPVEGSRPMKAGEVGSLDVLITSEMRQRYVVLDVPLPGGLEAVDITLRRTGYVRRVSHGPSHDAPRLPYDHHEIRDDRVLIFVDELPSGTYRYSVPVRVQHVGEYAFPPARAEAMYQPEVYGHTAGGTLRIE